MNTKGEDWVLYTLEEPVIRHRGQVRKCSINPQLKAINPLNVYNDEILKLAYSTYGLLKSSNREKVRNFYFIEMIIHF